MAMLSILMKGSEIQHVYGHKKRDAMLKEGWTLKAFIRGWNMSVTYNERVKEIDNN